MIRDFADDYAVLQNGFWRVEIDLARPRFVSLRADPEGLIRYCQEMLGPGIGGESLLATPSGSVTVNGKASATTFRGAKDPTSQATSCPQCGFMS
jgi:hypothetical protein